MGLGDTFADGEAEAGGVFALPRAEVGLKDVRQMVREDAFTQVLHLEGNAGGLEVLIRDELAGEHLRMIRHKGADDDLTAVRLGLLGIADEIAEEAAHLRGIERDGGQAGLDLNAIIDPRGAGVMREELVDEVTDVREAFNRRSTASKGEQLLDEILRLERGLLRGVQLGQGNGIAQAHLGEGDIAQQHSEEIVEIVRETTGQQTE